MGNRKLVWSSFGGTWHRVRVRCPRFWPRYGRPTSGLVIRGLVTGIVGGAVLRILGSDRRLMLLGLVILLFGVYLLVRALADLATAREITGEVRWRENWKSRGGGEDQPPVPWLDYVAIDDGSGDRTVAWGVLVCSAMSCHDGDTVTVTVRPRSRRVVALTVVGRGHTREIGSASPSPSPAPLPLFPASDVARMFGREVRATPIPWGTQYCAADNGRILLTVQSVPGGGGRLAWRLNSSRGVQHPGGFLVDGDRGVYRAGEATVVANRTGDGRVARAALPWLIEQALRRTPAG